MRNRESNEPVERKLRPALQRIATSGRRELRVKRKLQLRISVENEEYIHLEAMILMVLATAWIIR
jgi:hypothetical protein